MAGAPINFFCTAQHDYAVRSYVTQVRNLPFTFRIVHYEASGVPAPPGHYIFADLERVQPRGLVRLAGSWNRLASTSSTSRLLNHPLRSLRRYELLRALRESGANDFDACRVSERRSPRRFPVFLRDENEHSGALSSLLRSQAELDDALRNTIEGQRSRERILIVEFLDTADTEGLYRKYSAFNVGGELFPVHIQFSRNWIVKTADVVEPATVREEREFLDSFPQEQFIREVFRTAAIDFGRVDFSMFRGRPQIWEINTNPHLLAPTGDNPLRADVRNQFIERFTAALERIAVS